MLTVKLKNRVSLKANAINRKRDVIFRPGTVMRFKSDEDSHAIIETMDGAWSFGVDYGEIGSPKVIAPERVSS
jgi:hypothetical protein